MTNTESVNLTRIMEREGISRIARLGGGYIVYMDGNACGTGADVGEAYRNCLHERDIKCAERQAA